MTEEQSREWSGATGLVAAAIILTLLILSVIWLYGSQYGQQEPQFQWSETIMRALFGRSR
jgi:hypothetical protein